MEGEELSLKGEIVRDVYSDPLEKGELTSLEKIKRTIEERYSRIKQEKRRPGIEYVNSTDIREVFMDFVKQKEELLKMTEEELEELFEKWFHDKWIREKYTPSHPKEASECGIPSADASPPGCGCDKEWSIEKSLGIYEEDES